MDDPKPVSRPTTGWGKIAHRETLAGIVIGEAGTGGTGLFFNT